MNTAIIAEYLAFAHFIPPDAGPEYYRRLNRIALQLAMELPDEVLAVMWRKNASGTYQDAWDVVDAVRSVSGLDVRDQKHADVHKKGTRP